MKDSYLAISIFLAGISISFLAACQEAGRGQDWHLTARRQADTVELCLSNEENCPQPDGVSPSSISVYRYDSTFTNQLVWDTEPKNPIRNEKIGGVVTFGVPPSNWSNKLTPRALVCGKAYLVNPGANFFALRCDGTVAVFDSQHLEEFFRQDTLPRPTK